MTAIVVIGVPRSGTSVVSGVLSHLEVYWGEKFLDHGDMNPRGSFEDEGLALSFAQTTSTHRWDDFLPKLASQSAERYRLAGHAVTEFQKRVKEHKLWGFKCVRALVPGFFDVVMDRLSGIDKVKLVVPLCPVDICVQSIRERVPTIQEAQAAKAFMAARKRLEDIIDCGLPVHTLEYDDLIDSTVKEVKRLADWLKLPVKQEAVEFVTSSLRRTRKGK